MGTRPNFQWRLRATKDHPHLWLHPLIYYLFYAIKSVQCSDVPMVECLPRHNTTPLSQSARCTTSHLFLCACVAKGKPL